VAAATHVSGYTTHTGKRVGAYTRGRGSGFTLRHSPLGTTTLQHVRTRHRRLKPNAPLHPSQDSTLFEYTRAIQRHYALTRWDMAPQTHERGESGYQRRLRAGLAVRSGGKRHR
jgi:hypothetical protein